MQSTDGGDVPRPRVKLLKARMAHSRIFIALLVILLIMSGTQLSGDIVALKIMEWAGYILVVIGVFIRIYSSLYIGGRKNSDLIVDGPFSIVRNPLYVGSFIAVAGIGLQSTSLIILCLLIMGFIAYYPFVVLREEAFLTQRFGEAYTRYKKATPRIIPKFNLWHSPEELVCKPRFVLRTMCDGALFFLPLPLLDLLMTLHASGDIPVLMTLL